MALQLIQDDAIDELRRELTRMARIDQPDESVLLEMQLSDGEVELRAYPSYDGETMNFEVTVSRDADWHETLGTYGDENMRNGGPLYEQLDEQLNDAIVEALGNRAQFIMDKGATTFGADVSIEL